jgi:pyruvate formate lyase activating enzyme
MDQQQNLPVNEPPAPPPPSRRYPRRISRRTALGYGVSGLVCAACGGAAAYYFTNRVQSATTTVFKGDAPQGRLWQQWRKRGWVQEARHYLKLGQNVQCKLCPNECLLEPGDRGRCRNKVYKDDKLYTMAYANPCSFHVDPIEKKPLFHFIPDTGVFSIATSGCGFRCLNCQNWDISQRKPEETKDPRGDEIRLVPRLLDSLSRDQANRMSMFPEDVIALTRYYGCPSIAYTYSEPTSWYEYMFDTAKAAREQKIKNVWVTCGFIQEEPLVELCRYLDAANVDLKSFSGEIYETLNSGKLEPILSTLKTLKREGVWFEVTNLLVPTYTDKPDMIRRMCDWLLENLGPDYPLHFSRFHPQHRLTHLPPTPVEMLVQARTIAREAGLRYVYIGNCRDVENGETTFCPACQRPVIERNIYSVRAVNLEDGKCKNCGGEIAGVWTT